MQTFYGLLADTILVVHGLVVLFTIAAVPAIWLGRWRRWKFARNFWFRITHVSLIGFIAAEAVLGVICPLTHWEDQWRLKAGTAARYENGFISHWVHRFLFYDFDAWVFTAAYLVFFSLVVLTWFWVKPNRPGHRPAPRAAYELSEPAEGSTPESARNAASQPERR